jgi:hypothetical protein
MTVSLWICAIGGILYVLSDFIGKDIGELGRLCFFAGLLAYLLKG